MPWTASTNHSQIAEGTSFHIIESPQSEGEETRGLPVGTSLVIEFPSNERTKARVVQSSRGEAIIEIDGNQWRVTPWAQQDAPVLIRSPGMYSEDWVVRSRV